MDNKLIVVGIDGSVNSLKALQWSALLAEQSAARVQALMAWNYPYLASMPFFEMSVPPSDAMESATVEALEDVVKSTETAIEITDQQVSFGAPSTVLHDASRDADLLVLGRTGQSRLERLFVGSTSAYCSRHAECPVAIISHVNRGLFRSDDNDDRVIVGIDGSETSVDALVWAIEAFGATNSVRALYSHDEAVLDSVSIDDALRQRLIKEAEEVLQRVVTAACARTNVSVDQIEAAVLDGDPRSTLVDNATSNDLLVIGSQGHAGLSRLVLGSLADYALHNCKANLVIVRH